MSELADFDRPLFKILPKNDTGEAEGHQAGFLVTQPMQPHFPPLPTPSPTNRAVYTPISAALFMGDQNLGVAATRYQFQTRGATRSPEYRVTSGLSHWMRHAGAGDILVVERSLSDSTFYRFTLHKIGTSEYDRIRSEVGGRSSGVLNPLDPPVPAAEIAQAEAEEEAREAAPFEIFDPGARTTETRTRKIARSRVFQRRVSEAYEGKCAVCGRGMVNRHDKSEVEAAHIVPRGLKGPDDVRNGLGLCRSHHWAFDQGIFGIAADGTIHVPDAMSLRAENAEIASFHGGTLRPPVSAAARPDPAAFAWHMEQIVLKE